VLIGFGARIAPSWIKLAHRAADARSDLLYDSARPEQEGDMTRKIAAVVLGAVMLIAAMGLTAVQALRPSQQCPEGVATPPASTPPAYVTLASVRLGGPICLRLDRKRFFAKERAPIDRQADLVAAAETELERVRLSQKAAEGRAIAAVGDAKAAAQREAEAAVAATKVAERKASEARAALDLLPQRGKIFLLFDEVKVPMKGREIDIRPAPGEGEWIMQEIPLRGTDDASSDDGKAWREILGGPREGGKRSFKIGIAVAEGADEQPVKRAVLSQKAELEVFDPLLVVLGSVGLIILAAGVAMLGWNTGLLRDGDHTSQFSLGRVQMAWWLVLTVGGFLFIWLVSGQWKGVVTAGVIGLLGISATTGVAARMVDTSDATNAVKSMGFWSDLVRDPAGVALHRIQLIGWTVILGAIFVWTVVWSFAFPDFDTNLLLLAGIAGGTYLGFKFQE
jgi:hypothetical protein